jgi:hypothetical protein
MHVLVTRTKVKLRPRPCQRKCTSHPNYTPTYSLCSCSTKGPAILILLVVPEGTCSWVHHILEALTEFECCPAHHARVAAHHRSKTTHGPRRRIKRHVPVAESATNGFASSNEEQWSRNGCEHVRRIIGKTRLHDEYLGRTHSPTV